jgi:hypothetical protein
MSQASNNLTTGASPLGGGGLAAEIDNTNAAFASQHKNATRPSYAVAGMQWIEEISATEWNVYLYDGADDYLILSFNPSTDTSFTATLALALAGTDNTKFMTALRTKQAIDNALMFNPTEQAAPNMTVLIGAGSVWDGTTLTEKTAQSTATIVAPTAGNDRIDRVVIDEATGVVSIIAGTEAASPAVPALTVGKIPICQVLLDEADTTITDSMIIDERPSWFGALGKSAGEVLQVLTAIDAGSGTTAASLTNLNVGTINITPKSDDSTLIIEVSFQGQITAGGAGTNSQAIYQLYNNTAAADIGTSKSLTVSDGGGTNVNVAAPSHIAAIVTNSALTTIGFILRGFKTGGIATASATSMLWKITEVQN